MISLCMIVKNEIKYIEDCLKAVSPYVDEIVVVDTGSSDGTLLALEKFDCKVYNFVWCDDYAKARNFSVDKATNDWILFLDADEIVTKFDRKEIDKFINKGMTNTIGMISLKSYIGDISNTSIDRLPRLFNRKKFEFIRPIHEYLNPIDKTIRVATTEIPIFADHFGYLSSTTTNKDKDNRYIQLLKNALSNQYDPYLQKHLASAYYCIGDFDECINQANEVLSQKNSEKFDYFSETVCFKLQALIGLEKYQDALKLESYFDNCKDNDNYMYTMAIAYRHCGFNETALDIYEYLLKKPKLSINRLTVIFAIAELMYDCGIYDEALRWYNMLPKADDIAKKIKNCEDNI